MVGGGRGRRDREGECTRGGRERFSPRGGEVEGGGLEREDGRERGE